MKRGTPEHPKTKLLAELLQAPLPLAIGILELLWHWTARFTPRGDIGKYSDQAIEAAIFWTGKPGAAVKALIKSGWIDKNSVHRLIVHDWDQHCDQSVRKLLVRNHWGFASSVSGHLPDMSGHCPDMDILPKPKPEPEPEPVVCALQGTHTTLSAFPAIVEPSVSAKARRIAPHRRLARAAPDRSPPRRSPHKPPARASPPELRSIPAGQIE